MEWNTGGYQRRDQGYVSGIRNARGLEVSFGIQDTGVQAQVLDMERIRESFVYSSQKSIDTCSRELQIPRWTKRKVLHTRLRLHAYKIEIVQALSPNDHTVYYALATDILERLDVDSRFLKRVVFTAKATFHVSQRVNHHNVRMWGSVKPRAVWDVRWKMTSLKQQLFSDSCMTVWWNLFRQLPVHRQN